MPISFSGVSIVGYNASPPPDDGTAVASNQLTWSKHLTKIGGPLKTALEELNANLITAFNLGAAQADAALKAAENTFTENQEIAKASPIFTIRATTATDAALALYTNSIARGYLGAAGGAGGFVAGSVIGDVVLRAESGGMLFTGDGGVSISFGLSAAGVLTTKNLSAAEPGYKGAPLNSQVDNYTLVLTDAGKTIHISFAGAKTATIPANASVAFPIGTVVVFIGGCSGGMSIAITTDTLWLAGSSFATSGTRTLAYGGIATAVKMAATEWIISGTGLS